MMIFWWSSWNSTPHKANINVKACCSCRFSDRLSYDWNSESQSAEIDGQGPAAKYLISMSWVKRKQAKTPYFFSVIYLLSTPRIMYFLVCLFRNFYHQFLVWVGSLSQTTYACYTLSYAPGSLRTRLSQPTWKIILLQWENSHQIATSSSHFIL